jgi:hypothetical protein
MTHYVIRWPRGDSCRSGAAEEGRGAMTDHNRDYHDHNHDTGLAVRRRADGGCLADLACKRATHFQVRFDADAPKPVRRQTDVCADHLDGVVRYLNRWAAEADLTDGQLTILVLDMAARVRKPDAERSGVSAD